MRPSSALTLSWILAGGVGIASTAAPLKTIQVGERPESVTKGFGGLYYATVMRGQESGDAVIKVIDGDKISVFATGMDEPKGIAFTGDYLVTTDLKRVWKVDSHGHKSVLAGPDAFPHPPNYLNDCAAAPDGQSVFVTDMGIVSKMRDGEGHLWPLNSPRAKQIPAEGRVYKITLDGKVTLVAGPHQELLNPNGVSTPDGETLLIAEFFKGSLFEIEGKRFRRLATGFRGADGIERARGGNLYVSSWTQGKVWKLDPDGSNARVFAEGFQSAADFYLDEGAGVLLLPDMKAGTITFLPLK